MSKIEFFVFPPKQNTPNFSNWVSGIIFCLSPQTRNHIRFLSLFSPLYTWNSLASAGASAFLMYFEFDHFSLLLLLPFLEKLTVMLCLDFSHGLLTRLLTSYILFLKSIFHWFPFRNLLFYIIRPLQNYPTTFSLTPSTWAVLVFLTLFKPLVLLPASEHLQSYSLSVECCSLSPSHN